MKALLTEIKMVGTYNHPHPETGAPLPLRCTVLPWLNWEAAALEDALGVVLPSDLRQLWDLTSGLVLFQDMTYGQWGLVLWSPDQALVRHQRLAARRFNAPGDLLRGDFLIGEFIGDAELVAIRCDPTADDFGAVAIAEPINPRDEWPVPAPSLGEFLRRFLQSNLERSGERYWERRLQE